MKCTRSRCLESLVIILLPDTSRDVKEGHCFNTLKSQPLIELISRSTNFEALLNTFERTLPDSASNYIRIEY
jgi:hypothetical protein